jgi:predicted NUDIX family NTP pyrophosphohydrolase
MRHGRKSAARRFDGFKVSIATEAESELLLDIADMPANEGDGQQLIPTIQRVEAHADVQVARAIGDGAYHSGDNLAACANYPDHPIDLVTPCSQPANPEVDKSAFAIDLAAQTITCPQGHCIAGQPARDDQGRAILKFTFPRPVCAICPLFEACVRSRTSGRTVTTHAHEAELQQARARQATEAFQTLYRTRSHVERKIAELVRHGLRETRYLGTGKRQLQRLWTGAAVNLKRLFTLAHDRHIDLAALLAALEPPQRVAMPT